MYLKTYRLLKQLLPLTAIICFSCSISFSWSTSILSRFLDVALDDPLVIPLWRTPSISCNAISPSGLLLLAPSAECLHRCLLELDSPPTQPVLAQPPNGLPGTSIILSNQWDCWQWQSPQTQYTYQEKRKVFSVSMDHVMIWLINIVYIAFIELYSSLEFVLLTVLSQLWSPWVVRREVCYCFVIKLFTSMKPQRNLNQVILNNALRYFGLRSQTQGLLICWFPSKAFFTCSDEN